MSNGKTLWGQLLQGTLKIPVSFSQRMEDAATAQEKIGLPQYEVSPNDIDSSQVRHFELSAAAIDYVESYWKELPGQADIPLPDVLTALSVSQETGGGAGDYDELMVSSGSVGVSASGSAQASAFAVPKLSRTIQRFDGTNAPVKNCYFYLAEPTLANILVRLSAELGAAVGEWPDLLNKAQPLHFTLVGERAASSAKVSFAGSDSSGGSYESLGEGSSFDIAPSIEDIDIPPTLHGAFTLTSSFSQAYNAVGEITATGVIAGTPSVTAAATANASVAPGSVSATVPATVPTTGLYLFKPFIEPTEDVPGYTLVHAIVFDFAYFA